MHSSRVSRAVSRLVPFAVLAAAALAVSGCSEGIATAPPISKLIRSYDDTLTKDQQQDVISDLQNEAKQAEAQAKN
ncbi:hypothetical protein V6C03_11465 [Methyloligella sp. 2.7D]|uniref:hypothetical protein n=1 Tax=unclassified Methyloligella TaxID=2625955 RepID=UPI00157D573B|nr:hypothetical protein [Methyloligella sp. GL2]QKP77569.1 hypothetical protein HT051_08995 [Methyloligella sp. GL2]